jgi:hypothetical protein
MPRPKNIPEAKARYARQAAEGAMAMAEYRQEELAKRECMARLRAERENSQAEAKQEQVHPSDIRR